MSHREPKGFFEFASATTIYLDPSRGGTIFDAPLPFSRTISLPPGTTLLQMVVDGVVRVDKPNGSDGLCVADQ